MSEAAPSAKRVWLTRLLLIFGLLTLVGLAISAGLFLAMTDWSTLTAAEAETRLAEALVTAGGTEPYLQIQSDNSILLRRDLEPPQPAPIGRLHLMAWIPERSKLLEIRVPAWFVRLKSGSTFGLAALAAEFADELNGAKPLKMDDLQRRGPGLLLDLRLDRDRRLLLWSEAKD